MAVQTRHRVTVWFVAGALVVAYAVWQGNHDSAARAAKARTLRAQARAELQVIARAVKRLAADTGAWPGGCAAGEHADVEVWDLNSPDAGLTRAPADRPHPWSQGVCEWSAEARSSWAGPYLQTVARDPWGRSYFFDPDYFGRTGGVFAGPRGQNHPSPGCSRSVDAFGVIGSLGANGREYDCDDVVLVLGGPIR